MVGRVDLLLSLLDLDSKPDLGVFGLVLEDFPLLLVLSSWLFVSVSVGECPDGPFFGRVVGLLLSLLDLEPVSDSGLALDDLPPALTTTSVLEVIDRECASYEMDGYDVTGANVHTTDVTTKRLAIERNMMISLQYYENGKLSTLLALISASMLDQCVLK